MRAKWVTMVVGCSLLVDVSVHRGMLTMAGSWWGKNVITPKLNESIVVYILPGKQNVAWLSKYKKNCWVFATIVMSQPKQSSQILSQISYKNTPSAKILAEVN